MLAAALFYDKRCAGLGSLFLDEVEYSTYSTGTVLFLVFHFKEI